MHVKEPRTLIVKDKGLAPVFLDSRLEHPVGWICAHYKSSVLLLLLLWCYNRHLISSWNCSRLHNFSFSPLPFRNTNGRSRVLHLSPNHRRCRPMPSHPNLTLRISPPTRTSPTTRPRAIGRPLSLLAAGRGHSCRSLTPRAPSPAARGRWWHWRRRATRALGCSSDGSCLCRGLASMVSQPIRVSARGTLLWRWVEIPKTLHNLHLNLLRFIWRIKTSWHMYLP